MANLLIKFYNLALFAILLCKQDIIVKLTEFFTIKLVRGNSSSKRIRPDFLIFGSKMINIFASGAMI
jgi:spore coat polysaccharide biosynthesis predicted glycosyltransferase SpsG